MWKHGPGRAVGHNRSPTFVLRSGRLLPNLTHYGQKRPAIKAGLNTISDRRIALLNYISMRDILASRLCRDVECLHRDYFTRTYFENEDPPEDAIGLVTVISSPAIFMVRFSGVSVRLG
jgi:hypothetical protein